MNIHFSPEVRQSPDWPLVAAASELLPTIGSPEFVSDVEAAWSRVEYPTGQSAYRLSLKDLVGEVSEDYTADTLRNSQQTKLYMYHIWGDLLQIRSDHQHQVVRDLLRNYNTNGEG